MRRARSTSSAAHVPRAAVLVRPLQHLEVAALRRIRARVLVPRAVALAQPLQHLEVALMRRSPAHVFSFHGQSFWCAHCSTSRWPPHAAHWQTCVLSK